MLSGRDTDYTEVASLVHDTIEADADGALYAWMCEGSLGYSEKYAAERHLFKKVASYPMPPMLQDQVNCIHCSLLLLL